MNVFERLYKDLKKKYGRPSGQWVLWCKRPKTEKEREEVVIEAILTQRANWRNVELAMANLKKKKKYSLRTIYNLGKTNFKELTNLLKPSGFFLAKTNYLLGLSEFILKNYGNIETMKNEKTARMRERLLGLKGIGEETADDILLYALDKPVFVIDEYTRRLVKKYRLTGNLSYRSLQRLFEKNLKKDYRLYQDFHALIVIDEKSNLK